MVEPANLQDLIVHLPNHGYSDDDALYISWLDGIYYVSDKSQDSFKLATTAGGDTLVQYSYETITSGFVRQVDDTSDVTSVSGLDHLEGEYVYVTADGVLVGLYAVSGGSITVPKSIYIYSVGLPYNSTLQPMKLDIAFLGLATTKKIPKAIANFYETYGGEYGTGTDNMVAFSYDDVSLFTGIKEVPVAGGYEKEGDIIIRQTQPYPMTVLSLTLDLGVYND